DWTNRSTCILFGDGAGAVVLSPADGERGILSSHLHSDGTFWDLICVPGGGSRIPPSEKMLADGLQYLKMKGNETFKVAVKTLEEVAREALSANHLSVEDLDLYIPHQANVRIIKAVADRLKLPMEKVVMNLDRYGNTSAASIPLALDEAVKAGRIQDGDLVLMEAFGGGLTWASAVIRW
ncbi:MAG: 3-oxoacyl-ACP synthase, partial [Nitrospiraceae bacterium]